MPVSPTWRPWPEVTWHPRQYLRVIVEPAGLKNGVNSMHSVTWLLGDLEFLFSNSTRYLTSEHSKRVRDRVEHSKRNFNLGTPMYYSLYLKLSCFWKYNVLTFRQSIGQTL